MAKFYNATNGLKEQIHQFEKLQKICLFCCYIVPIVLFVCSSFIAKIFKTAYISNITIVLGIVALAVFIKLYYFYAKKIRIFTSGYKGESRTQIFFLSLPDEYSVVTNANIVFDGHKSELDSIVVGPTGVYIAEIKNYSGEILGNANDHYLINKKGENTKQFYNPIKQVGTHTYRLANFLRYHGFKVVVKNCVFFSSDNIRIEVDGQENSKTPLLLGKSNLIEYLSYGEKTLDSETIRKICELIISSQPQ